MTNVSLDETLFYQYMIDNNSTSTMLNALSGNRTEDSGYGDMASVLKTLTASSSWGTGSISDVSTLLGGANGQLSGILSSDNSFLSILQTYLGQGQQSVSGVMEQMQQVLEEAEMTEGHTKSYQTVQSIYETLSEMTSYGSNAIQGLQEQKSSIQKPETEISAMSYGGESDFETLVAQAEEVMENAFVEIWE